MTAYGPMGVPAVYDEAKVLEATFAEAGRLRTLGDRPIVVLTAMKTPSADVLEGEGMTAADWARFRKVWVSMQDDEATWSTRSRHQFVGDAAHYIQFDRPDVVIAAVEEVAGEVRAEVAAPAAR